jgi:hypothetical protein
MPSVSFDDDVSGSDSAALSPSNVYFVSVDLLDIGLNPRPIDDVDHIIRAGWFALCDTFDIGLGSNLYCRAPVYINFEHTLWTPDPTGIDGGATLVTVATTIRWYFAPGVAAHIHVLSN